MATQLQPQTPAMPESDADSIDYLAEGFSALADPTRLRIVHLLMTQGEMCVCEFMPLLDLTQSNVTFHLKAHKYARIITCRKEGRWMLYSLNRRELERFMTQFGKAFDLDKWPEGGMSEPNDEAIRRRIACQQQGVSGFDRLSQNSQTYRYIVEC